MGGELSRRLVPDRLWSAVLPLVPEPGPRPQGGGTAPLDGRDVFTAIVFVLVSGCAWHRLPDVFRVSPSTAHRRFVAWTEAGLWERLRRALEQHRDPCDDHAWLVAIVDTAHARSCRGWTGPRRAGVSSPSARRPVGPARTGSG